MPKDAKRGLRPLEPISDIEASAISRIRGAGKAAAEKANRINWTGVREEYVTGSETLAQVAKRIGLSPKAVERHAADREENDGKTWADRRDEFREDVAHRFRAEAGKRQLDAALSVHDGQVKHTADLVAAAIPVALAALANGEVAGADAVKIAIAALRAQGQVHGLDRVMAARVEVTGKDGGPIEHDTPLGGELDDGIAERGRSLLKALFGKAADSG